MRQFHLYQIITSNRGQFRIAMIEVESSNGVLGLPVILRILHVYRNQ